MPEHHDSADTIAGWLEERTGREVRGSSGHKMAV